MRLLSTIPCVLVAACAATGAEPALELGVRGLPRALELELRSAQARLQIDPRSAAAWCDLGDAWTTFARRSSAPEAARRARSSYVRARALGGATEPRARAGEIEVALLRERREEALALAVEACARFPGETRLESARIEALIASGRTEAARSLVDELERAKVATTSAQAGVALAEGDFAFAERIVVLDTEPVTVAGARLRASIAEARARSGGAREALAWIAMARAPSDEGQVELELAVAAMELRVAAGERDEQLAASALARSDALRASGLFPRALVLAARALKLLGRDEEAGWRAREAEEAFRRAVDAGERYAHAPLAELLVEHGGDLDEALDLARRVAREMPTIELRALVERIELLRAQR